MSSSLRKQSQHRDKSKSQHREKKPHSNPSQMANSSTSNLFERTELGLIKKVSSSLRKRSQHRDKSMSQHKEKKPHHIPSRMANSSTSKEKVYSVVRYSNFPYLLSKTKSKSSLKRKSKSKSKSRYKPKVLSESKVVLKFARCPKGRYKKIEDALKVANPPLMGVRAISYLMKQQPSIIDLMTPSDSRNRKRMSVPKKQLQSKDSEQIQTSVSSHQVHRSDSKMKVPRNLSASLSEGVLNSGLTRKWFGSFAIRKEPGKKLTVL